MYTSGQRQVAELRRFKLGGAGPSDQDLQARDLIIQLTAAPGSGGYRDFFFDVNGPFPILLLVRLSSINRAVPLGDNPSGPRTRFSTHALTSRNARSNSPT
jgi:hypothetical protein